MSYVKIPQRPRTGSSKSGLSGKAAEKKKKTRKKPGWDDTVNDLSVHKASPEELIRRKTVTKSQNLDLVKADILRKQIAKARKKDKVPGYARSKRSNVFLREVLQEENDIAETLVKSDRIMASVKDIFGDNPGKFRGLPNVTTAPEGTVPPDEKLPNGSVYSNRSKLDILSETIMDQTALNELDDSSESGSDHEEDDGSISYKPSMDMERFRRLLQKAELEEEKQKGKRQLSQSMAERALQKALDKITKSTDDSWLADDGHVTPDSPEPSSQLDGAINDTAKVKRTKSCTNHNANTAPPVANWNATADDLQQVLENMESSLAEYEQQTGRQPSSKYSLPGQQQTTFSSYATSLVISVTKLISYFKENDMKLREESALTQQLSQDVQHLKALVNSLTVDIIYQREEFAKLQSEFFYFKSDTEIQIHALRQALIAHGIPVPTVPSLPRPTSEVPLFTNLPSQTRESSIVPGLPRPHMQPEGHGHPNGNQGQGQMSNINAAMLLSPPKQTDSPRPDGGKVCTTGTDTSHQVQTRFEHGLHQGTLLQQGVLNVGGTRLASGDRTALQQNMQQLIQQQLHQGEMLQQSAAQRGSHQSQHCLEVQDKLSQEQQLQQQQQQSLQQQSLQQQQHREQQQSLQQQQQKEQQQQVPVTLAQQQLTTGYSTYQRQFMAGQHPSQEQQQLNEELDVQTLRTTASGRPSHYATLPSGQYGTGTEAEVFPEGHSNDDVDGDMLLIQKQLEELNRQHEATQSKLKKIYSFHEVQPPTSENSTVPNQGAVPARRSTVSPSISPIPPASEFSIQSVQSGAGNKQSAGRVITVSIPRADVTDSTVTSQRGAPHARTSGGRKTDSGQQMTAGRRNNALTNNKTSWFALSSHVATS